MPVPETIKQKVAKRSRSKLGTLTLLNLLGLIELGKLAMHLKINQADGIDDSLVLVNNSMQLIAQVAAKFSI